MKKFLAVALISALSASAANAELIATLDYLGVAADFETNEFDVYQISIDSTEALDVTTLELSLPGVDMIPGDPVFNTANSLDGAFNALPTFFGFNIPGSFFITPGDEPALPGDQSSTPTELRGAWTVSGTTPLVPAGGSAVVATISVAPGAPFQLPLVLGVGVVDGQRVEVLGIPEPATIGLASLALAGVVIRRRK